MQQYRTPANLEARLGLHERFSANPSGLPRWIFNQFDLSSSAQILELGCGVGRLWQENAGRIPFNWRILLTDLSPGMLEKARENTAGILPDLAYMIVNAIDLPFASGMFDAVIANHMLYHVTPLANRERALRGIRRVLKPGGRFYTATNGQHHLYEMGELIKEFDHTVSFFGDIAGFSLENGPALITGWFECVEVRRYPDALIVTEVQPLIDYILSISAIAQLSNERKAELSEFIRQRFAEHEGVFHIRKDVGLITAIATDR